MYKKYFILSILLVLFFGHFFADAARIKDIATIEGVSSSQVIGYGLVSGLNNTGDNQMSTFTVQSVTNLLKRFGLTVPQTNPRIRNVAAVMVTATIPAFARKGSKIDVQVSSMGDATSLQGGVLLMSPVSLSDGTILGMAQGALSVSGFDYNSLGTRISKNMVTSGRVPGGLILEKDIDAKFVKNQQIRVVLRDPDFSTSDSIAKVISKVTVQGLPLVATAVDAGIIQVQLPSGFKQGQIVEAIAQIEVQQVNTNPVARVVINERTGTVVVGGNVELLPVVIAHGGMEISIQKQVIVVPPAPFTVNPPQSAEVAVIKADEQVSPAMAITTKKATVEDIAAALNMLKVTPRDLIAIFQALKESGSLQGELIIQ